MKYLICFAWFACFLAAYAQGAAPGDTLNTHNIILKERFGIIENRSFELYIDPTNYTHPIENTKITSRFGIRDVKRTNWYEVGIHRGVDVGANVGTPVRCIFDGMVRIARYDPGYGNVVVVSHKDGLESLYAHLDCIYVTEGQEITTGKIIALSGNTGSSTGPHLHFELSVPEGRFDPQLMIDFKNRCLKSNLLE